MNKAQQHKFKSLYQQHISALRRQGKAASAINVYGRAVRRITEFYNLCPNRLTPEHLKEYFGALMQSHSWRTVKVDRNRLYAVSVCDVDYEFYQTTTGTTVKSGAVNTAMHVARRERDRACSTMG